MSMEPLIEFIVPAIPVGQPRPRASFRGGHAHVHEQTQIVNKAAGTRRPHPVLAFKATTKQVASQAFTGAPLQGPLRMDVEFVFPRTGGQIWKKRPMPRLFHDKKPDRDNCEKALLDSLKGIVFADDAQVCAGEVRKFIAAGDEQPHVRVRFWELSKETA